MKRLITALLLAVFFAPVSADTLTWVWTHPTTRTDGTLFDMATEGLGYNLFINGELDPVSPLDRGDTAIARTLPAGQVCLSLQTIDADGRTSTITEQVCKSALAAPGEATNITVTVTVE